MNANLPSSLSLSRPERRDEVRRLYFRCQLPMQRIAEKLGVSRYTVWRDVQRWQERMPDLANPDSRHSLIEILREMDDLKTGAWRAWETRNAECGVRNDTGTGNAKGESRNVERDELAKKGTLDAAAELAANRRIESPKASSDASLISAITRLLAQQAKLVALVEDRAAKAEEEKKSGANVVLYLPDNGRDRHLQPGIPSVERAPSGEFRTRSAGDSDRSRRSNEADANVGRLDGGCLAGSANPTASNREAYSLARAEEGRCEFASANVQGENSAANPTASNRGAYSRARTEEDRCDFAGANVQRENSAANPAASDRGPSAVPLLTPGAVQRETGNANRELANPLQQVATKLQQNVTDCNGLNEADSGANNACNDGCKTAPVESSQTRTRYATEYVPGIYVKPGRGLPASLAWVPERESEPLPNWPAWTKTNEELLQELGGERTSLLDW